jgi:hypothetical protein
MNKTTARLLAALCLGAMTLPTQAGNGTSTCPGSTLAPYARASQPLSAADLLPGSTLNTLGSNLGNSPELAGLPFNAESIAFHIDTPSGRLRGTLDQDVVNADNATCDRRWRVRVSPKTPAGIRITELRIFKFKHPKAHLKGDFRDDLFAADVAPLLVQRSTGKGTTIRFVFEQGLGAGQASRVMFLDTAVDTVVQGGYVQLVTNDGSASAPIHTNVPVF